MNTNEQRLYASMTAEIKAQFTEGELPDIASHGADSGWGGFTYTSDCVAFFNRHSDAIWAALYDDAQDMGEPILTMVAGFGRADMADTYDGFLNLLAWYALERVAREVTDAGDDEETPDDDDDDDE